MATLVLSCALAFTARAADPSTGGKRAKKVELTEEQKKLKKELLDKYDTNKDGKLSAEEKKAVSADDKKKLAEVGLGGARQKTKSN